MARSMCVNVIPSKAIFQFRNYATKLQAPPAALQSFVLQLTRAINWLPAILAATVFAFVSASAGVYEADESQSGIVRGCRVVKQINAFHGR